MVKAVERGVVVFVHPIYINDGRLHITRRVLMYLTAYFAFSISSLQPSPISI